MPHRRAEFSAIRRVSFRVLAATKTPALSLCAGKMNQWNRVSRHLALDSGQREERRSIEQSGRVISSGRAWIEIAAVERLYRRGTRIQELFLGNGHAIRTKCRTRTPWHFADGTNYASGSAPVPTCRSKRSRIGNLTDGPEWAWSSHVAAREKKKALGPCELRALLRDEPSSPCTRHGRRRVTWHNRTLRSDNASYCSGARPSA